jgi:DNA (cytosine-5)-methyltransferase 1
LIIVGLRTGEFRFPFPSHGPDSLDGRSYYTAKLAIADLPRTKCNTTLGGRHGHLLKDIPPGLNYSFYTEKLGHPEPLFAWRSKFSDYLYKADPDTPVRTIKAQGGQYTGPFHWGSRPFTISELKRLQTFPDYYEFVGSRQQVIQQIGNSVPPQLGRVLALSVAHQIFDVKTPFDLIYMRETHKLGFRQRKRELTNIYAKKAARAISKLKNNPSPGHSIKRSVKRVEVAEDLRLVKPSSTNSVGYKLSVSPRLKSISVSLAELREPNRKPQYGISFSTNNLILQKYGIEQVSLISRSDEHTSVLALWRHLELLVRTHFYKDDLVQLFGYYQYQQGTTFDFEFHNPDLEKDHFWKILSNLTRGNSVGKVHTIGDLADMHSVTKKHLHASLVNLKTVGFEIRSHNTNRQIKRDSILIPYAFPSLNERSLQRLTVL